MKTRLLLLLALCALGACGQKGPLYLPQPEKPVEKTTPAAPQSANQS
jgi:predicted small lipoprotein YifL